MPPRLVGLYALTCMEREGDVYGYSLADRIAERTEGAWRPGPGAIYPALSMLTKRGLARSRLVGRRRVYSITPRGRAVLARMRAHTTSWSSRAPDVSALWAEVWGVQDAGTFLVLRLRRALDAIDSALASHPTGGPPRSSLASLRGTVVGELANRLDHLRRLKPGRTRTSAPRPKGASR